MCSAALWPGQKDWSQCWEIKRPTLSEMRAAVLAPFRITLRRFCTDGVVSGPSTRVEMLPYRVGLQPNKMWKLQVRARHGVPLQGRRSLTSESSVALQPKAFG